MQIRRRPPVATGVASGVASAALVSVTADRVGAVLAGGFKLLRFPDVLEDGFAEATEAARRRTLSRGYFGGLLCYLLLTPALARLAPDVAGRVYAVHLGLVTPLVLGFLLWLRRRPPALTRELAAALLAVAGGLGATYLRLCSGAPGATHHQYVLLLLMLFTNLVLPLRFRFALGCTVVLLALYTILAWHLGALPGETPDWAAWLVAAAALASLLACYRLEYEERRAWLLRLHDNLRSAGLDESNRQLEALTSTDPLTGLPNRRRFQARLDQSWLDALAEDRPVAVLMIDVDHFKAYNDHYGHLDGDACLRRVGGILAGGLRATDLLCRYGGEEFVAVLPGTCETSARLVAERMRQALEAAALPHHGVGPACVVTVSIGAAALVPQPRRAAGELVAIADAALYAAKRAGRNRVASPQRAAASDAAAPEATVADAAVPEAAVPEAAASQAAE